MQAAKTRIKLEICGNWLLKMHWDEYPLDLFIDAAKKSFTDVRKNYSDPSSCEIVIAMPKEERQLQQTKKVYANLCKFLDKNDWKHTRDEEKLSISSSAHGEDLPIDIRIHVDADRQLVILYSQLPFHIKEEKRAEAAIAISMINYGLVDGSFDFDMKTGAIIFRLTSSFLESPLGENLFGYMIQCTMAVVDHFNDKLLMYSKGVLTLEQLV